ncbi:hypothetical protein ACHWQZ_G002715 [Mnemiopsis leidyi]
MVNQHNDMMRLLCSGTNIKFKDTHDKLKEKQLPKIAVSDTVNLKKRHKICVKGFDVPEPLGTFAELKASHPKILKSVLQKISDNEITAPTPIQMQCIPLLMDKRCILSCAPTGSGKTLCFILPVLSHIKKSEKGSFRALVLSPTRELAKQTYGEFKKFGGSRKFSYHFLSKASANSDILTKDCGNKDVLIATPMHLLRMLKEDRIDLSKLQFCILDEADRLFDSQFKDDVTQILEFIDLVKVTVGLFSATLANGIDEWCFSNLDNFVQVYIGTVNGANSNIRQSLKFVGTEESKLYTLKILIQGGFQPPMLVFTQTKDRAKQVFEELKLINSKADVIHSELSQLKREEVMDNFRSGKTWILICTDLMGRGIDFKNVNCVVNFDLPQTKVDYIHRIGRSGRAGKEGKAITFFTEQDKERLPSIINVLKNSGCELPGWLTNMKGIARRDYKKATKKPVKRNDISTVPRYDKEKAKKRKAIIADSKAKKKTKLDTADK